MGIRGSENRKRDDKRNDAAVREREHRIERFLRHKRDEENNFLARKAKP